MGGGRGFAACEDRDEFHFQAVAGQPYVDMFEGVDDPVGIAQAFERMRMERGEHRASGGVAGGCARSGIFNNEAIGGIEAEQGCALQVRLGVGLAGGDIFRRNDAGGNRDTSLSQAATRNARRGGSYDCPAICWQSLKYPTNPSECLQTHFVVDLRLLQPFEFLVRVEVRAKAADGLNGTDTVRHADSRGGIEAASLGPLFPGALDGSERADQHAIHVEENAAGMQDDGVF